MVPKCEPILRVTLRLPAAVRPAARKNGEKLRSFVKRKSQQKHPPPRPPRRDCLALLLSALCGIIVLMHLTASFFPEGRIWGFNQWAYFSPAVSLSLGALALLLFVPRVSELVRRNLDVVASSFLKLFDRAKKIFHRRVWYAVCSLLFFIPFWLFRDRTHLLGDGTQIIDNMNSGGLVVKWSQPLEIFLHLKAFDLAGKLWQVDAAAVYVMLSCLAGMLFVFFLFLFADFWGKERREKVLVFLVLLGMGSTQLFFGYVEHYSFLFLFTFVFIFVSIAYMEGKLRWFFPLAAFFLAFLSHLSALYLFPSLLFLFFAKGARGRSVLVKRILILAFGAFAFGSLLVLYKNHSWTVPPIFVPLSVDTYSAPGYLLFSSAHLLDFVNQQLLVSPVGLIMLLAPLACVALSALLKEKVFQFLLLISLSQLLFGLVGDPGLGAPRDWDLFSAVGLGYTVLGLLIFLRLYSSRAAFGYLSMILIASSLYCTIPWIGIQASERRSVARFENLLEIDVKRGYSGHFALSKYFRSRGMDSQAERQDERYWHAFPELALMAEASRLAKAGKLEEAEKKFLEAERLAPKLAQIHNNLGKIYLDSKRLEKAERELKKAIRLSPFLPDAYVNLADLYVLRQQYDLALNTSEKAIRLKTDIPDAYFNAATIYLIKGDTEKAEAYYRRVLALAPEFVDAHVGLGDIYNRKAMPQEAIRMYQAALTLNPHLAIARFRLGITYLSLNATQEAEEQLQMYLNISPGGKEAERVGEILKKLRLPKP